MRLTKEQYLGIPKKVLEAVNYYEENPTFPFYIEPNEYFVLDAFAYMTKLTKELDTFHKPQIGD